jgi:hypothetical protein
MNRNRFHPFLAAIAAAALAAACTQKNSGDTPNPSTAPVGLNRFLLFPNPVAMNAGGFETDTTAYAQAYYAAIDPTSAKDTIDKWKTQNQFGTGTGTELLAVFRDAKDLGYGRRMTGRMNTDGSVAFFVENYNVTPNGSGNYSSVLNVEAAINRDTRWHVGTNAIEWSSATCTPLDPPDCNPNVRFAKYFNFSSKDGTRQLAVDLDGNGLKAMPGPCITCHGGRGDPLTPPDANTGLPRFPLVENAVSRKRGDVQAKLHGMNVDSFEYSPDIAGFSKTDQQATLKLFNQWILCTYPLAGAPAGAEDACRVPAGPNEWQGTAAEMIKQWYGGPGMSNANFNDLDPAGLPLYVPTGWGGVAGVAGPGTPFPNTNPPITDVQLYKDVVAPYCRTCHILRGTKNQNDLDFTTLVKFQGYADRIRAHVFDRGTMPLALIVYNDFWNSNAPRELANAINPSLDALVPPLPPVSDSSGAPFKPGRPIADPGPNRMVRTGANATLSAENSLFASSFSWSQVSGPVIAQIVNPSSMITQFNASAAGSYVMQLTVSNGSLSDSKQVTVTVDNAFPDPANLKFAQVKNVLQNHAPTACTSCHTVTAVPQPGTVPPIWYNTFDRDGSGGVADATDDAWFLKAVQGRVNLTEIEASPLLRKPSGNHHNGGTLFNLGTQAGLQDYSVFYNWILAGMPGGGVAANPVINNGVTPATVIFAGSPLSASFPLNGVTSIGAVNYQWSILSGPNGPAGTPPSIAGATLSATTLSVFNVGTYTVQLQVDDGAGATDTAQRSIVVNESPITASFSPGDLSAIFAGDTTLTPDAVGVNGSPTTCRWQVISGPAGATLDGSSTLDVTKPCTFTITFIGITLTLNNSADLNVPLSVAVGSQYQVRLTASNIGSSSVTHTFTVSNSVPTPSLANTASPVSTSFASTGSNLSVPTSSTTSGPVNGSVAFAIVGANLTLNGSASTTPTGTLSYFWCLNGAQPDPNFLASGITACPTETSSGTTATLPINVRATGPYSVRLRVNNGVASNTTTKTVTINPSGGIAFPVIVNTFSSAGCLGCHQYSATGMGPLTGIFNPAELSGFPPPWDNASTADTATIYMRVRQRVQTGRLLTCPHSGCGGMPAQSTFSLTGAGSNFDNFSKWINDGAPPGN